MWTGLNKKTYWFIQTGCSTDRANASTCDVAGHLATFHITHCAASTLTFYCSAIFCMPHSGVGNGGMRPRQHSAGGGIWFPGQSRRSCPWMLSAFLPLMSSSVHITAQMVLKQKPYITNFAPWHLPLTDMSSRGAPLSGTGQYHTAGVSAHTQHCNIGLVKPKKLKRLD